MTVLLKVRHFGAFGVYHGDGQGIQLGAKHQALLALLTTGEGGVRTRAFLENTLWCLSQPEQAKASLRTALSTLKRHLGSDAAKALVANRERVTLKMDLVEVDADPSKGEFMEGFELAHEEEFANWLQKMRMQYESTPNVRSTEVDAGNIRKPVDTILPSITVLPFQLREQTEENSPVAAVLSEELTRTLGRTQSFSVTSFLAARHFDPATCTPASVSAATHATFIASGSVSVSGAQLVLDLDLNDARRGRLVWSRRYEADVDQLLKGDTDVLQKMARDISRSIVGEALEQTSFAPLGDLESHTLLMASVALMQNGQRALFERAKDVLTVLADRAPGHPILHCWQGIWHVLRVEHGLSDNRQADILAARAHADAALNAEPMFSLGHTLNAMIEAQLTFHFEASLASLTLALEDNPNEAMALAIKALISAYLDMPDEAVKLAEDARRLMPLGPQKYYFETVSAIAHLAGGNFPQAVERGEQALSSNPGYPQTLRVLSVANQMLRKAGNGRDAIALLLAQTPGYALQPQRRIRHVTGHPALMAGSS